jgi:hypothetical protein
MVGAVPRLVAVAILVLSSVACRGGDRDSAEAPPAGGPGETSAAAEAPPAGESAGRITRVQTNVPYRCASGRQLTATYVGDSLAIVGYEGISLRMLSQAAASEYVGDGYAWRRVRVPDGAERAPLRRVQPAGSAVAETCSRMKYPTGI